jgi:hypothetical protein
MPIFLHSLKKESRLNRIFLPFLRQSPNFKVVVQAAGTSLQTEVCNIQLDLLSSTNRYNPFAVLTVGIVVGVVWRIQYALTGEVCPTTHCNKKHVSSISLILFNRSTPPNLLIAYIDAFNIQAYFSSRRINDFS